MERRMENEEIDSVSDSPERETDRSHLFFVVVNDLVQKLLF
ncbi:MAG: hypothetical protein Q4G69_13230 [Planctomycetia bacterium]|nr:hypothetical protein [Planctomycetia bacterium]